MSELDKREVSRILREIAALLELRGESVYKTRAYEKAADRLLAFVDRARARDRGEAS